jgi:sRNA-binding regulator protein Hfq
MRDSQFALHKPSYSESSVISKNMNFTFKSKSWIKWNVFFKNGITFQKEILQFDSDCINNLKWTKQTQLYLLLKLGVVVETAWWKFLLRCRCFGCMWGDFGEGDE